MRVSCTFRLQLRAKGVQSYGIGPMIAEKDRDIGGAHTDDERLEVSALYKFMEYIWNAVTEIAASKK